jgi:lipid-A-disaccharide synthase
MPLKLMISAAEVSGDVHGAALALELKKARPDIHLFGMGGEKMAAAGVNVRLDITDKSTIGVIEPLKFIPSHIRSLKFLVQLMKDERPDALIVIDAQGFHMPLVKEAKKLNIRTIYYIAPQEWLWGTERGVKSVAKAVDLIVAVFQKEFEAYKKAGANVVYFGHPVLDIAKPSQTKERLKLASYVEADAPFVGLFPGSRRQEIERLLPVMLDAIKLIRVKFGKINPLLGLSSSKFRDKVEQMVERSNVNLSIVEGGTYDTLSAADVSIAASGTILLEAAVLDAPIIMTYKLSPLSYFIGKRILKIDRKLPYYSMPNIMAGERIIPEFVMADANAENIANEVVSLLADRSKIEKMKRAFARVKALLGEPGVVTRAARGILNFLLS